MSDDIKCCVDGCPYDAEIEVERKDATLWICGDHFKAFFQSKTRKACGKEFHVGQQVMISEGWEDARRRARVLGPSVQTHEDGNWWLPIVFDGQEDPDFHKACGLEAASLGPRTQFPGGCAQCYANDFKILEVADNPDAKLVPGFQPMKDILAKCIGSRNKLNAVKATLNALAKLRTIRDIAQLRGKKIQEIIKGSHVAA